MGLEIIGAGFGRTGTSSLRSALVHLGFGPCHHMYEVRDHPEQLAGWQAAAQGRPVDWDLVFRGYRSQTDWPGARYWRELAGHFPTARVILSVRDPDSWFDSIEATINRFFAGRGNHRSPHLNAMAEMGYETIAVQVFGGRLTDRAHAKRVFEEHVAAVQAEIAPERLLTFDPRDGWGPLCDFLGVAVPKIPFPWVNISQDFGKAATPRLTGDA